MPVEDWVKSLVEEVAGGPPVEVGKFYQHPEDGVIEITSGQYWGAHGISNFWYWRVVETGKTHHGYAERWEETSVPNPIDDNDERHQMAERIASYSGSSEVLEEHLAEADQIIAKRDNKTE